MMNMMSGLMGSLMNGIMTGIEQSAQQARARGFALNDQGIAQYRAGEYALAALSFRQALQLVPDDANVRDNLRQTEEILAQARAEAEQRNREQLAAARDRISTMLGGLSGEFSRETPSAGSDLDFLRPEGTSFFGTGGGSPSQPDRTAPPSESQGASLTLLAPGESLFSRGTQGSAPPSMPDPAESRLRDSPSQASPPKDDGLSLVAPDATITTAQSTPRFPAPPPPGARPSTTSTPVPAQGAPAVGPAAILASAMKASGGDWDAARNHLFKMRQERPDDPSVKKALEELERLYAPIRREIAGDSDPAPAGTRARRPILPPRLVLDGNSQAEYEANMLANEAFYRVGKDDAAVETLLARAAELAPTDNGIRLALSSARRWNETVAAIQSKAPNTDLPVRHVPPEKIAAARSYSEVGRWWMEHGEYGQALVSYTHALKAFPAEQTIADTRRALTALELQRGRGKPQRSYLPDPYAEFRTWVFDPKSGDGALSLLENLAKP
ncbi:MAG: tetratricopeptide repeat protein [Alphaproteobacteria bacterium]|nr:tetratricopeptide repeat protein [Alphaproteobacteria bacterium]